jgi:prolyl-tRNA synthetase
MKFSRLFIKTTKDAPSDAILPSHQYLVKGGFISQEGAGLYNYLPLGKMVLDNIRNIVKKELDDAGCNEVQLSFVTPLKLWQESGRADTMDKEMLKIKDRKDTSFVLSPTNEEAMVNLVRSRVNSYKDLPLNLYQINTKFRDEARPRFGILRAREFLMKDGYSFHTSVEDMQREFALMEQTYKNIFTKLGLNFRVVDANSGDIGGSGSKEFHLLANSGEDTIVVCESCEYGANIETIYSDEAQIDALNELTYEELQTKTIEQKCQCKGELYFKKGIEIGHIFQLHDRYTKPLKAQYLDENQKMQNMIMGTYGIGISRLIASVIEQNHDDKGCIWTATTTPFMCEVIVSNGKKQEELDAGLKIYEQLKQNNISTIIDDRIKQSYGFKMKDFELLGFPYAIVVGKKLSEGMVEIVCRKTLEKTLIPLNDIISYIKSRI